MEMIIGRSFTPLKSSRTMGSVRAGVTTTRAGECRMSVWTAGLPAQVVQCRSTAPGGFFDPRSMRGGILTERDLVDVRCDLLRRPAVSDGVQWGPLCRGTWLVELCEPHRVRGHPS